MSGIAGPVIKTIGILIKSNEKKRTSNEIDRSKNSDLKGENTLNCIILFDVIYIDNFRKTAKKNAEL